MSYEKIYDDRKLDFSEKGVVNPFIENIFYWLEENAENIYQDEKGILAEIPFHNLPNISDLCDDETYRYWVNNNKYHLILDDIIKAYQIEENEFINELRRHHIRNTEGYLMIG